MKFLKNQCNLKELELSSQVLIITCQTTNINASEQNLSKHEHARRWNEERKA
jgi:hypothetical protein